MGAGQAKRTYLVVVDDSEESRVALRFAARRAAKTNGRIEGKYFFVQFDRSSGELVTAFVPNNSQLTAILRKLRS